MGYLGNHLATVATGVFAAVLTGLWPYFLDFAPLLNFIFIMAVPIAWFMVFTCWIAQKSADYMHSHAPAHAEKKSLASAEALEVADESQVSLVEIKKVQDELMSDLADVRETVKLKDGEIERLNEEIANLKTLVQIESLKTELANLKMLAAKKK